MGGCALVVVVAAACVCVLGGSLASKSDEGATMKIAGSRWWIGEQGRELCMVAKRCRVRGGWA